MNDKRHTFLITGKVYTARINEDGKITDRKELKVSNELFPLITGSNIEPFEINVTDIEGEITSRSQLTFTVIWLEIPKSQLRRLYNFLRGIPSWFWN